MLSESCGVHLKRTPLTGKTCGVHLKRTPLTGKTSIIFMCILYFLREKVFLYLIQNSFTNTNRMNPISTPFTFLCSTRTFFRVPKSAKSTKPYPRTRNSQSVTFSYAPCYRTVLLYLSVCLLVVVKRHRLRPCLLLPPVLQPPPPPLPLAPR